MLKNGCIKSNIPRVCAQGVQSTGRYLVSVVCTAPTIGAKNHTKGCIVCTGWYPLRSASLQPFPLWFDRPSILFCTRSICFLTSPIAVFPRPQIRAFQTNRIASSIRWSLQGGFNQFELAACNGNLTSPNLHNHVFTFSDSSLSR